MANGLLNARGTPNTSAPTAEQANTFATKMNAFDWQGAADYGRSLGYTDDQIATYTGGQGFKDDAGNTITAQNAADWMKPKGTPGVTPTGTPAGTNPYQSLTGDYAFQQGRDAAYNQATSRLDPQFQTQQRNLENQLTQQGIMRGTEAWNREMDNFSRDKNDAYGSAWNNAWNNGLQGQNQKFTQDFSNRSLAQQGQIANRGLDLQGRSIDNQFALGNRGLDLNSRGLDLQQQNQTWNQGFQRDQFDYRKVNDQLNRETARTNADRNGLFGLGAVALTNPNAINMLKQVGSGLVDAAGKVTQSGIDWLRNNGYIGGNGDTTNYSNEGRGSTPTGDTSTIPTSQIIPDPNSPTGFVDATGQYVHEDGTPYNGDW